MSEEKLFTVEHCSKGWVVVSGSMKSGDWWLVSREYPLAHDAMEECRELNRLSDAYRLAGVNEAIDRTRIECHKMFDETVCEMQKDADRRVREALEMAAKEAESLTLMHENNLHLNNPYQGVIAKAIRVLSAKLSSGEVKSSGEKGGE